MNQDKEKIAVPEWIDGFLKKSFFGKCRYHSGVDVNRYCITCQASDCKDCMEIDGHVDYDHQVIKIYRHVYQEAVLVSEMEKHMDCSKIQTYKCNKKLVVPREPLPHNGSGSLKLSESCRVCTRKLRDPASFHYCSIRCMVESINCDGEEAGIGKEKKSKRSRKGIPHRAAASSTI